MSQEQDTPLQEREALMMAYVDDELGADDRRRFEAMLTEDPSLAAEVADYQTMLDIGRSAERLEPTEQEMRRFWARFYNRAQWRLGWLLIVAGGVVLLAYGGYELCCAPLPLIVKVAVLSVTAGGSLLLWSTVRQKVRSGRFDRYRGVTR